MRFLFCGSFFIVHPVVNCDTVINRLLSVISAQRVCIIVSHSQIILLVFSAVSSYPQNPCVINGAAEFVMGCKLK